MEIKAQIKNDILKKSYYGKFTTEKIKENKYMSIFDDLNEICIEILERIKLNAIKVKEIDNILNVIIQLPNSKIKEINFELNEVE